MSNPYGICRDCVSVFAILNEANAHIAANGKPHRVHIINPAPVVVTDSMVEAGARALFERGVHLGLWGPMALWELAHEIDKEQFYRQSRAVLTAALGKDTK